MELPECKKYNVSYMNNKLYTGPTAFRMAKTLWSFGHSECNRVKVFTQIMHIWSRHISLAILVYQQDLAMYRIACL